MKEMPVPMRKMASLPVRKSKIIQQIIVLEIVHARCMHGFIDFVYVCYEFHSIFRYINANKQFIQVSPSECWARPLGAGLSIRTTLKIVATKPLTSKTASTQ